MTLSKPVPHQNAFLSHTLPSIPKTLFRTGKRFKISFWI